MSIIVITRHFDHVQNDWQTPKQIAEATGLTVEVCSWGCPHLVARGRAEKQGGYGEKSYRLTGDATPRPKKEKRLGKTRVEQIAAEFCAKHGVSSPYQATMKSQEAMLEWSRVTE